jgi:hypothetical protein
MNAANLKQTANLGVRGSGRFKIRVLDGKTKKVLEERPWQKNLILNPGIRDADGTIFRDQLGNCRAGTGTTPSKATLDGTFALSGTTLTRSTGAGTFSAGDVDKYVKFGTGEEHLIVSYTSSTEVEVRDSGTVAATTLELYDTARVDLDAEVTDHTSLNGDAGANTETMDTATGNLLVKRTYDFAVEVGTVNYNEIGISRLVAGDLWSRIVLASTVTVNAGQQLQVVYELSLTCSTWLTLTSITPTVSGWPWQYTNTDIADTATEFVVTFDDDHHYSVGDEITISGATPSAYNGTWTVAAVPTSDSIEITSGINPGNSTVHGTTVGTLAAEVRLKSASNEVPFEDSGGSAWQICDPNSSSSQLVLGAVQEANVMATLGLGTGSITTSGVTNATRAKTKSAMDSNDFSWERTGTFDIDEANWTDFRQYWLQGYIGTNKAAIVVTFDQNQRKDSGYILTLGYKVTFRQDLP